MYDWFVLVLSCLPAYLFMHVLLGGGCVFQRAINRFSGYSILCLGFRLVDLTHRTLCDIAVKWLMRPNSGKGHGCQFAVSEVATGWRGEIPDAIGFRTESSYRGSVVVEVKMSRADFLADFKKPHRNGEIEAIGNWRYYLCPTDLIKPEELPPKWGLLYINSRGHVKHIVSPFTSDSWKVQSAWLVYNRFDANTNREMYLMTKLLSRLGDVEKFNNMLKEANNRASSMERRIDRMNEQSRKRSFRQMEINSKLWKLEEANKAMEKALVDIKNCPDADLSKYCQSVDDIACETLAKLEAGDLCKN